MSCFTPELPIFFHEILTAGGSGIGLVAEQGKSGASDGGLHQPFRSPLSGRNSETAAMFTKYKKKTSRKPLGTAFASTRASTLTEPTVRAQPIGETHDVGFA